MIGRNFVRVKVLQAIYAYEASGCQKQSVALKNLLKEFDENYELYIMLLAMFGNLTAMAQEIIDNKKRKFIPTQDDLKPNSKFVNNQFILLLDANPSLQQHLADINNPWANDVAQVFIRKIYDMLSNNDIYINYMQSSESNFKEDKQFVLSIVEHFILDNDTLMHYFGDIKLHWYHDFNDIVLLVYKTLSSFTKDHASDFTLPPMFKIDHDGQSEDKQFLIDLFNKTIQLKEEHLRIISDNIRNWEMERIAAIDLILLEMAICEFCEFPSIPLRVTLNEYIELAKYYSTPKSKSFINGLLDNILGILKAEGKIHKQGRGLMG
ncbi:MAG: transcription antitermination factor NusB [Bacteroidales bacterium]|nr:transcription antitermination factor NusB [Bacteroidales bacterium]MBP5412175.1 transcription antitermination factor NusB [Bacteroidales bacterium]